MTISLDEFHKLQKRVNTLQKEADQAEGAMKQLLADLKARYGVKSEEEAEALLKTLEKEELKVGKEYGEQMEQFNDTYGHLLRQED